jgi:hypothetical protein
MCPNQQYLYKSCCNFNTLIVCSSRIVRYRSYTSTESKIHVFVCYRPFSPYAYLVAVQYTTDLCNCVNSLYPLNSTARICSDFKFPIIDWSANISVTSSNLTRRGIFVEFYYTHDLHRLVPGPTSGKHIVDLVFCNDINGVLVCKYFSHLVRVIIAMCALIYGKNLSHPHDYHITNSRDIKYADLSDIKSYVDGADFHSHLSASSS